MSKEIPKPYIGMPVTFNGGASAAVVTRLCTYPDDSRVDLTWCSGTSWYEEHSVPLDTVLPDGGRQLKNHTWWPAGFEP